MEPLRYHKHVFFISSFSYIQCDLLLDGRLIDSVDRSFCPYTEE